MRQGAVTLLRAEDTNRMLFLQSPAGMWEVPGGGRERDESPLEAALAELAEETGYVHGEALYYLTTIRAPGREYAVFEGRVSREFVPMLSAEHVDHRWSYPSMPPRPIHATLHELLVTCYGATA